MVKETRLGITAKKDEDFGKWYSEACRFGELVEYYESVKGCYILKPSGISDEYLERYTNTTLKGLLQRLLGLQELVDKRTQGPPFEAACMTHGDDKGLVFPPKVAPVQVVVIHVPIKGAADYQELCDACEAVESTLLGAGIRAEADIRDNYSCGWKYADQELTGVPLRIETGPRDLANDQVRIVTRDNGAKMDVKRGDLIEQVKDLLEKIQSNLYDVAKRKVEECTQKVETWDEFVEALSQKKLILAPWCDKVEVEKDVKRRTRGDETGGGGGGAKTLCTPLEQPELGEETLCFASGKPPKKWSYWGRSY
ncbi:putative proline--tRNA ligase [Arabidopsis thaliana]